MRAKNWVTILLAMILLFSNVGYADLGPKPEVYLKISQTDGAEYNILLSWMMKCVGKPSGDRYGLVRTGESDIDPEMLEDFYAYRLYGHEIVQAIARTVKYVDEECTWEYAEFAWSECTRDHCRFWYHLPEYFRVALLTDNNEIIVTPPARRTSFASSYEITLYPDGTSTIRDITPVTAQDWVRSAVISLILTLIIELTFAAIWWRRRRATVSRRRLLSIVAGTNVITVPALWWAMYNVSGEFLAKLLLLEIAVVIAEAAAIHYGTKRNIDMRSALWLSVGMNVASLILGLFIEVLLIAMLGLPLLP